MSRLLFITLLSILSCCATAQYYSTGQDPASLRWSQIRTDRFRVVFPASSGHEGRHLADILELAAEHETKTLKSSVPNMPVVLHSLSSRSNAITVWAPRRIELYPVPPQDTYAEDWSEQLVLHEYRHAVQTAKMNQGFTKALYYLFGEQAAGAVLGLFIPTWFLEGDAVCAETGLSSSGRGRIPAFENILRAQLLEKGIYSYDKASMGSYRTFIPDPYVLGYHLIAWGREQYGSGFWNEPLDRAARYPFMVVPFNSGLRKNSGMYKRKFYLAALNDLKQRWEIQDSVVNPEVATFITKRNSRNFTNYSSPVWMNDTSLLLCKESMDHRLRFVTLDLKNKRERTLFIPGIIDQGGIGYCANRAVWSERRPDPRWEHRNYMILRGYDFERKRSFDITKKTRLFVPALSGDGAHIAAVESDPEGMCSLVDVDVSTGAQKTLYQCTGRDFIMEPQWSGDNSRIIFIMLNKYGKALCELDIITGELMILIPPSYREIKNPFYINETEISFTADYSGIDNIYIYNCLDKTIKKMTSSRFGASQSCSPIIRNRVYHLDYTADGTMVASTLINRQSVPLSGETDDMSIRLDEILAVQESCNIQDSMIRRSTGNKPVERYSKAGHLFNLHSWAPLSINVSNLEINPGVSLFSQNLLSTLVASAGYLWDYQERTGKVYAGISYSGLYPVIGLEYSYGRRAGTFSDTIHDEVSRFTWDESEATLSAGIPFNFSRGRWTRSLSPKVSTSVTSYLHNSSTPSELIKGYEWPVTYSISGGNYYYESGRSLYPRWGQLAGITYEHTPFKGIDAGSMLAAYGSLYFPGILRHHGIWIYGGYQERFRKPGQSYYFSNIIAYPRGSTSANDDVAVSMQFNYKFPVFYPDWSLGSITYLKRLKMNLFFDYAEGRNEHTTEFYSSAGTEVTVDLHILRFVFPMELGLRAGYYFPLQEPFFEFLYSFTL